VIFKGKRIAVIRELSGSRYIPDPDKSGPGPESVEELIKAVCAETLKTLHSYNTRTRGNFRPETIYFGGRLSAYRDAQALISSLVNAPCERVNIVKDGKLRMDINLSPVYDPPLMESALALALREARKSSGFNFRRGEFKAGKSVLGQIKHVKTTIIMLAVLLCMLIVNAGTDYYFVSKRHSQMISEFDKIAPEFSGIKNARGKITAASQKLRSLNNPSSDLSNDINPAQRVLDIIRDLSVRINEQYSFDISTLIINSREVTIKANYDSYDTSKLERALKSSDLYKNVIITSNRKGEGVILDVKLERAD
jgi:hypothetical protein